MLDGINMTLMIGPVAPVPVPRSVLDALISVEVITGEQSGFELQFNLTNDSPLHTLFLLSGGAMMPIVRVVIIITIGGTPTVIMDGVMSNHQVRPGPSSNSSVLVIKGKDLSAVMAYIDFSGFPYPCMPAEARVLTILSKYAFLGIVPMVMPALIPDVPIPIESIPAQKGKDLDYIQYLAKENGYVFYIEPGPVPLANIAYWGPEMKTGVPQPALSWNMDAQTNVENITVNFNTEQSTMPMLLLLNAETKAAIPIPVPDITPLSPPLGALPPITKHYEFIPVGAHSTAKAVLAGITRAASSAEVIEAKGSLDVSRYGRVLSARKLVGLRGVGTAHDGTYYVRSVSHSIKRGGYRQEFTLTRNGIVSTLPKVVV